jgi:hypothetical protein
MSSLNNLPVYSPQQQQQVYQPPPLTQEQLSEMANYYNQIYQKLFQILYTEYGKKYIDGLNLFQLAQSSNEIPKDKINNIFKHLLRYTYSATASEIANHQEINAQLKEIKETLSKLIKQEIPKVAEKVPE